MLHSVSLNHQAGFSFSSYVAEVHGSIVSWLQFSLEDMVLFMIEIPIISTLNGRVALFISDGRSDNRDRKMRRLVGRERFLQREHRILLVLSKAECLKFCHRGQRSRADSGIIAMWVTMLPTVFAALAWRTADSRVELRIFSSLLSSDGVDGETSAYYHPQYKGFLQARVDI